ncbi:uncharacterized protein LOC143154862 [Ptiloglossa arizonensis]|uniref:uncharacterized protein LOC143154862 n=1 Tax=Ptiloglossa arizonensis TaxID=3350558 RepID=UPI003F9FA823
MMGSRRCEYCYCISGARRCIRPKCLLPLPGCTPLYAPHSCCPVAYNCTHLHSSTLAPVVGNGCRVGSRVYDEGEMVRDIEWKAACDNCFCAMGAVRCVPLACAPPLQGCSPIVRDGHCCPSTYNCSGSIEVKATQNYASYAFISKDYAKFRKETNFFPAAEQITNPPVEGRGHRVVEERIDSSTMDREESPNPTDPTSWPSTFETDIMDNEIMVETVDYVKSSPEITTTTPANPEELTTTIDSMTLESTLASKEDDSANDLSTTFSTSTVDGSTIVAIEDLSSIEDTTTERTTPLTEVTGNDTAMEDETRTNVTVRNKNTIVSNSTNAAFKEDFEHANSTEPWRIDGSNVHTFIYLQRSEGTAVHDDPERYQILFILTDTRLPKSIFNVNVDHKWFFLVPIAMGKIAENCSPMKKKNHIFLLMNRINFPMYLETVRVKRCRFDTRFKRCRFDTQLKRCQFHTQSVEAMEPVETTESITKGAVTKTSSSVLMPDDILVMNVTVKTNVSVGHIQGVTINPIRSIPPDVEAILNITHREKGEDYDYDYSEPTLPPSLPNVRIIPFVAADALVKDKTVSSPVTGYPSGSVVVPPELRPTDTSGFYDIATQENRFSPPVETEGGFVPREPPYFDASYHSTDLNLEIGTAVTVVPAPITNPHRKSDGNGSSLVFSFELLRIFTAPNFHHTFLPMKLLTTTLGYIVHCCTAELYYVHNYSVTYNLLYHCSLSYHLTILLISILHHSLFHYPAICSTKSLLVSLHCYTDYFHNILPLTAIISPKVQFFRNVHYYSRYYPPLTQLFSYYTSSHCSNFTKMQFFHNVHNYSRYYPTLTQLFSHYTSSHCYNFTKMQFFHNVHYYSVYYPTLTQLFSHYTSSHCYNFTKMQFFHNCNSSITILPLTAIISPKVQFFHNVHYYSIILSTSDTIIFILYFLSLPQSHQQSSNCLFENMEHRHGEILPSSNICVICMCYYGEVVCSSEKCPPLKIGCRRINTEEACCGKIVCVEADESPTVVLDRADATAPSLHQPIVSPDPFRDVIKTEPAPDLPSLIEDMIPYLVEHGITTPRPTTTTTAKSLQTQGSNHPQHASNFDYMDKLPLIHPPYDYRQEEGPDRLISKNNYATNQDAHPKEAIPPSYNTKDIDQTLDHVSETVPAIGVFDFDRLNLPVLEHTTEKPDDRSHPVNVTDPGPSKSNSSGNEDTAIGSMSKDPPSNTDDFKVHSTTGKASDDLEPIFSLDSVLDLLFSSDNDPSSESTRSPGVSTTSGSTIETKNTTESTLNTREPVTETGSPSKVLDNEIPVSVASLLKLAGCNIYGRMYRVGRIITELSGPCLECRCTEIGVQCKQLQC